MMDDIKPVAWCLMTNKGEVINGVHTEERLAAQYRHRQADDTMNPLYTLGQISQALFERDLLIRDLRKELNERRYGRSIPE